MTSSTENTEQPPSSLQHMLPPFTAPHTISHIPLSLASISIGNVREFFVTRLVLHDSKNIPPKFPYNLIHRRPFWPVGEAHDTNIYSIMSDELMPTTFLLKAQSKYEEAILLLRFGMPLANSQYWYNAQELQCMLKQGGLPKFPNHFNNQKRWSQIKTMQELKKKASRRRVGAVLNPIGIW